MNKPGIVLLIAISSMSLFNAKAQSANEIVNKWIGAMGGREKLASFQTLYAESDVNIMNNPATSKTFLVNGKGYKTETDFSGQKIIDCYTVNGGWNINPLAGQATATPMTAIQVKLGQLQLEAAGPLFEYASKGSKVELLGKEGFNGSNVYKLMLTTASGLQLSFFINDSSFYIMKQVTKTNADGQDIEITIVSSDFRKTPNGFILPFSNEVSISGLTITITSKKIEINSAIDPVIFEIPKN